MADIELRTGYVVRMVEDERPLYLYRGPALFGPADDYHMGDSLSSAAVFFSRSVAEGVAKHSLTPEQFGRAEIYPVRRETRLGNESARITPRPGPASPPGPGSA